MNIGANASTWSVRNNVQSAWDKTHRLEGAARSDTKQARQGFCSRAVPEGTPPFRSQRWGACRLAKPRKTLVSTQSAKRPRRHIDLLALLLCASHSSSQAASLAQHLRLQCLARPTMSVEEARKKATSRLIQHVAELAAESNADSSTNSSKLLRRTSVLRKGKRPVGRRAERRGCGWRHRAG